MSKIGLLEAMIPYLDKTFDDIHGQFRCLGWRWIFHIQEIVYKEVVIEFLATMSFARKDGIYADNNLTLCLGGERQGFKVELHWNAIANGFYDKGTAQESDIRYPIHRLLHRLITDTINQQQEGDKCPTIDIFFLWDLTSDNTHVDLPFLLVDFLAVRAGKDRRGSPLYGGMLITLIACSYGVLEKREAMMLIVEPKNPYSTLLYKMANIAIDHVYGNFGIPDDTSRGRVPRRVRPRGNDPKGEEPPLYPTNDEMPTDPYNIAMRRFDDNFTWGVNYTNMGLDHLM
ncbi:unnamed protein product [Lactuca saligna]|uniref:Uncharacterized protein n=1 Tax=Lactuca saligna TaxID=75948 RepID=A0AA36E724_LACSI|nr:unnamed protein product [Lactuca saligna]